MVIIRSGIAPHQAGRRTTAGVDAAPGQRGDTVLLAAGDEPLIISRTGAARVVVTSLDFGSAEITYDSEIPLLVNLMFERLLGGRLLNEIAMADRGPGSANVVPSGGARASADLRAATEWHPTRDLTRQLLLAALLVLLWEIVALGRQRYRLSACAGADSN
ncbi:MAG: hypothetical protein IPI73_17090 [Betaproteobacteria bacterium]|nr:hypothetical protein [Betaproteobacteria bacterium]